MTLKGFSGDAVSGDRSEPARFTARQWPHVVGMRLLVADPSEEQRLAFTAEVGAEGVSVTWCHDGIEGLVALGRTVPDAAIVTPSLAGVDAVTFVRALREYGPVPVLVAMDSADAGAAGPLFLAGATAAVTRPYVPHEVMARLSVEIPDIATRSRLQYGPLELDPRAYVVRLAGKTLEDLPLKEFELLRVLMVHGDQVVSTEEIREALWGAAADAPSSNAIAVHAARLRSRLGDHVRLRRVRGRGYRLSRD